MSQRTVTIKNCDVCEKDFNGSKWFDGPPIVRRGVTLYSPTYDLIGGQDFRPKEGLPRVDLCIKCKNDIILKWAKAINEQENQEKEN